MDKDSHNAPAAAENNFQGPRALWKTKKDPSTGEVRVTNPEDDPWDTGVLLQFPHGAKSVDPGPAVLDIYVAMLIGDRSKTRDFSDLVDLDRCKHDVRTAITYVLGWVEAAAPAGLDEEAKHRTIMQQLRSMPMEMLDKTYNRYRMENQGINLDDHQNTGATKPSTRWALPRLATSRWPTSSLPKTLDQANKGILAKGHQQTNIGK